MLLFKTLQLHQLNAQEPVHRTGDIEPIGGWGGGLIVALNQERMTFKFNRAVASPNNAKGPSLEQGSLVMSPEVATLACECSLPR